MSILSDADRLQVRKLLGQMVAPVRLAFFTQTLGCETCLPTRQILDELVSASDLLRVEEHNFLLDKDKVAEFGIERVPAIAVLNGVDPGIRYYGVPSHYEFSALIDAVLMVSRGESGLSAESLALVRGVAAPVAIQVFVTPT
jgi:alkyl hydroperoxide reductase subunit AhpF